jgi:hypothetical protein
MPVTVTDTDQWSVVNDIEFGRAAAELGLRNSLLYNTFSTCMTLANLAAGMALYMVCLPCQCCWCAFRCCVKPPMLAAVTAVLLH